MGQIMGEKMSNFTDEGAKQFAASIVEVEQKCVESLMRRGATMSDLCYISKPGGDRALIDQRTGIGYRFDVVQEVSGDSHTLKYVATPVVSSPGIIDCTTK